MDHFQFLQSPVAAAREWWYTNVWRDAAEDDDDDDIEDQLKDLADDNSSQCSENVVKLRVGIHCEECKRIVTDALWCMPGVDRVDVDRGTQKVTVTGKMSTKRVLRTVRRTGKRVELWKAESKKDSSNESHTNNSTSTTVAQEAEEEEESCTIM